jgi:hypothetical protein
MKVLSVNYCEGEEEEIQTRLMELQPRAMQNVYEVLKKHNVVHLNVTEMTMEEFSALEPA